MSRVTVTIARGDRENRYCSRYAVPAGGGVSVLDLLDYIYENLDPTLAYFSHEACRQTACGKCLVRVNGEVCLACARAAGSDDLTIEPWNERVLRDLVCE